MSTPDIINVDTFEHPYLDADVFVTDLNTTLGSLESPPDLVNLLSASASTELPWSEDIKPTVRRLLRHGGFKPSGRNKPASEYLVQAVKNERLGSINPVVDAVNAASYHGGLPISVVDYDRLTGVPRLMIAEKGTSYVFNATGQTIDLGGLLCLADDAGPCANAVKDSQRTKTCGTTRTILTVVWGTVELPERTQLVSAFYKQLLQRYVVTAH